ncbi:MAG TPA: hypothetical protein VFQ40_04915 [Actinomycetota bacterium]|nr:hypothetical protein [Actinomycetota bacterium]
MDPEHQPVGVPGPPDPLATTDLVRAAIGGLAGAMLGGLIWGLIVSAIDAELGIAAIGVGVLAGFGVVLLCRHARGVPLQVIAGLCALIGVVFGKYFAFVQVVNDELGAGTASLFSGRTFDAFVELFGDLFSGFDLLWVAFAVYTAWRIPQGQGFGRWAPGRTQPPPPAP